MVGSLALGGQTMQLFSIASGRLVSAGAHWWRGLIAFAERFSGWDGGRTATSARAESGFARLVLPHLDAAYSLACYLSGSAEAAEDIVQEAYLKAFSAFSSFRGGDDRAWILTIVRNCARDWRQRQGLARRRFVPLALDDDAPDDAVDAAAIMAIAADLRSAEAELMRREEDQRVRDIVDRMPETLREVLLLREFEDLSYRQIAEMTGAPMGTVMSRLARARELFTRIWAGLEAEANR
ncbi:MAG: sigma-70 family RNA polymerase sigma factor [Ancalomicrobiaceae bacterium]|nr:sigma-70 family RNA polymerase sigma factor [Ancalomicrobiaceae bacterium]